VVGCEAAGGTVGDLDPPEQAVTVTARVTAAAHNGDERMIPLSSVTDGADDRSDDRCHRDEYRRSGTAATCAGPLHVTPPVKAP
jgi:hypothetical protein